MRAVLPTGRKGPDGRYTGRYTPGLQGPDMVLPGKEKTLTAFWRGQRNTPPAPRQASESACKVPTGRRRTRQVVASPQHSAGTAASDRVRLLRPARAPRVIGAHLTGAAQDAPVRPLQGVRAPAQPRIRPWVPPPLPDGAGNQAEGALASAVIGNSFTHSSHRSGVLLTNAPSAARRRQSGPNLCIVSPRESGE